MNRLDNQEGMTLISWMVTLIGIGVALLVGIRLVPVYIEAYEVGSILQTMQGESGLRDSSKPEILKTFQKRLDINNIDNVSKDNLTMTKVRNGMQLVVNYQARVHLLGNLDAVASFRKEALIRN